MMISASFKGPLGLWQVPQRSRDFGIRSSLLCREQSQLCDEEAGLPCSALADTCEHVLHRADFYPPNSMTLAELFELLVGDALRCVGTRGEQDSSGMKDMTTSRRRLANSRDCFFIICAIRVAVRNLICCPLSGSTARNKSKSVRSADARTRASKRSSFAPATENRSRKRSDCFGLIVKTLKPRARSASTRTRRRISIAMKTSLDDAQAISATRVSKSPLSWRTERPANPNRPVVVLILKRAP